MEQINKRVVLLIEKLASSKSEFAKTTGISSVILSHISSGRNKVSLSAIVQILQAYKSLNPEWLVLGIGEMYKSSSNTTMLNALETKVLELQIEYNETYVKVDSKIEQLLKQIRSLNH